MSSLLETSHPASAHSPAQVNYGTSIGRTDMTSVDSALAATRTLDRKWTRSTEMIIAHGRPQHLSDGFDDEEEEEEQVATTEVEHETPYGVRKMTAITNTLSRKNLVYLYATVLIISVVVSVESQCTNGVEPYFLSLFSAHAFISTIAVVTNIAFAVGKPPMAQILDHFGRPEGLAFAAAFYAAGYLLTAFSGSVTVFAFARILSAFGAQGLQLAQQVLIADTTTLSNRALFTSIISLPFLGTIWFGPLLTQAFLGMGQIGYRLSYGLFGVLVPALCAPLILALWWHHRRLLKTREERLARNEERATAALPHGQHDRRRLSRRVVSIASVLTTQTTMSWLERDADSLVAELWRELDVTGLILFTISCTAFLLPLSLAATRPESWSALWVWASFAFSIFTGWLLLLHERNAASPILPLRLLHNRTLMAGCGLGLSHFVCQFTYESYFSSYLQVAREHNVIEAQYISQSYIFAACLAALFAGLLCKWTRRYRIWGLFGVISHIIGAILMLESRRPGAPTSALVWAQLIGGVGGGFTTLCAQLGIQAVVVHEDLARATAFFLTVTQLGGAVGGAFAGAIWSSSLPGRLREYLPAESQSEIQSIIGSIAVALSYQPGTPTRIGIERAYTEVQHILNTVALVALVPALLCMLAMQEVELPDEMNAEGVVKLATATTADDTASIHSNDSERSALLPPSRS